MRFFLVALVILLAVPWRHSSPIFASRIQSELRKASASPISFRILFGPVGAMLPLAVLLVTPEHAFLVRHPLPSDDFEHVGYDSLLQSEVYVRDRVFSLSIVAATPAVGSVSTVV